MIAYFDPSALVKRYTVETGSTEVEQIVGQTAVAGTSLVSRAEIAAALGKAVRVGALTRDEGEQALHKFREHWPYLKRLKLTEATVAQADALAWDYGLRGFDAVHLATAVLWQSALDEAVTFVVFDRQLWEAGQRAGLGVWPEALE